MILLKIKLVRKDNSCEEQDEGWGVEKVRTIEDDEIYEGWQLRWLGRET